MSAGSQNGASAPSGIDAELRPPQARRRFGRVRPPAAGEQLDADESIASLHAEVLLLREENARLNTARHRASDISGLLARARALSSAEVDRDAHSDDTVQLFVEGLVIRESLLEICQEMERSMVAFEAKLNALASSAIAGGAPPLNGHDATSP
jgi:hypothetical protein